MFGSSEKNHREDREGEPIVLLDERDLLPPVGSMTVDEVEKAMIERNLRQHGGKRWCGRVGRCVLIGGNSMIQHGHESGTIHLDLPVEPTPCSRFITPRARPELYPGTRPEWSYCFVGERILPVCVKGRELLVHHDGKWQSLARFVENVNGCPLAERYAVLAVGSNACPARLADPDKFGEHPAAAIPVLRGFVNGLVSVYAPRMAVYGSVPSTVMALPGARSELWVTLLSEAELFHMDKSEGRGSTYGLVEIPSRIFSLNGGVRIGPLSAYYQPKALRDRETGKSILLDCFDVAGADLPSMSQVAVQGFVDDVTHGIIDPEEKNRLLVGEWSLDLQLPGDACAIDPDAAPSRYAGIVGLADR